MSLPAHLEKYVVEQNGRNYTAEDQALWRYLLRQLVSLLKVNAHPAYFEGLSQTGIGIDEIPQISEIDRCLKKFGWNAVPVSGFIPPAAFMEFQAHSILPIASDMRSIDHLAYTPAPDIIHEAAGHAPFLAHPEYAAYLKNYARVAAKSILSKEDLDQYEAIRILSDIKEDPSSTSQQIEAAQKKLELANEQIQFVSEAGLLSRMNWWTAEYGLVGDLENPTIYGAGLLSSLGEAESGLRPEVKKIPLTVDCIDFSYDITERQPQLFVTPDFAHLSSVLNALEQRMSFQVGGIPGMETAIKSRTVCTLAMDSGIQVSGQIDRFEQIEGEIVFIALKGPCQLSHRGRQLSGHSPKFHSSGFSSPLGRPIGFEKPLADFDENDLAEKGLSQGHRARLAFSSGTVVDGVIEGFTQVENKLILISWSDCSVKNGDQILFDPDWGTFDLSVGESIDSVFGGPADRSQFGGIEDFVAKRVEQKRNTPQELVKFEFYQSIRDLRSQPDQQSVLNLFERYRNELPSLWLAGVEILELGHQVKLPVEKLGQWTELIRSSNGLLDQEILPYVEKGIRLAPLTNDDL